MLVIPPSTAVGCSNPLIWFAYQTEGRLTDVAELSFQIWQYPQNGGAATQLFPASPARETVLLDDCPVGGRLSQGRYAATWAGSATAGRYFVRWFWKPTATSNEQTVDKPFEIASVVGAFPIYTGIAELRDECLEGSDARLYMAALVATRLIDKITGRSFGAAYATRRLDGRGARAQLLWEPVIGVDRVAIDTEPSSQGDLEVETSNFRVYNRHLSGLLNPDDRDDPKIEFVHSLDLFGIDSRARFMPLHGISLRSLAFPVGVQNVELRGLFGYTDPDGSPWGTVPPLIAYAARLLAAREVGGIGESECRTAARDGWRVVSEKTRDQMVTYSQPRKFGEWIGDPEIDSILTMFFRLPMMGAV